MNLSELNYVTLSSVNQTTIELLDSFLNFVQKINFDFASFLDIFVLTILTFFALVLFKKTQAMPIIIGIAFLGAVYGLSLLLNLRLTQIVFHSFFGMFVLIMAIVFQRELRRLFEFIGILGLKRKFFIPPKPILNEIIYVVEKLAAGKTGALLVFPGRENLERHLVGGIPLNGKVSAALLLSLFDKNSVGHDGAAIMEGDHIRRFAVHLPLAEHTELDKKYGTRHRAALGIAERTDALCIVVSEERGEISLAYDKKLVKMKDEKMLQQKLEKFFESTFPAGKTGAFRMAFTAHIQTFIFSVLIAVSAWAIFTYQTSIIQTKYTIPIQFKNLSKEYMVTTYIPEELIVVLSGRESDFNLLDQRPVKAAIDLSNVQPGWHQIIIKKEHLTFPVNLTLIKAEPISIKIQIAKIETGEIPQ